jgi:hypothetical protein
MRVCRRFLLDPRTIRGKIQADLLIQVIQVGSFREVTILTTGNHGEDERRMKTTTAAGVFAVSIVAGYIWYSVKCSMICNPRRA